MRDVVTNTSPLLYLHQLGLLGLARRHARLLGLTITGTLGVLLRAKNEGFLPAVAPVVDKLEQLGFRLAPETRAAVLRLAGE